MNLVIALKNHLSEQPVRHLLVITSVSAATIWCMRRLMHRMRYNYPPGPFALPVIGNSSLISKIGSNALSECDRLYDEYGDMVTLMVGTVPVVLVLSPELALEAMISKQMSDRSAPFFSFNYQTEGMNDIFAAGSGSKHWRYHRKAFHSAFRQFVQSDRLEIFAIDSFDFVKKYFTEPAQPHDLYDTVYLLMYNVMYRLVFNKELTPTDPEFLRIRRTVDGVNQGSINLSADGVPFLQHLPLKSTSDFCKAADGLIDWAKKSCEERQKVFDASQMNGILDFLIREQLEAQKSGNGDLCQDVHLRQTLIDIFTAGTDTTTFSLYWLILALSKHPDMQERCFAEICSTVGQDRTPTLAHRDSLPYTDAFVQEVIRRHPILATVPRRCKEDCTLGGYTLPKGTQLILSSFRNNFNPKLFTDPQEFKPERFLDKTGKMAPYQRGYVPFGAGTRVCLGETFAKKSIFLMTVLLIQSFRFEKFEDFESDISDSSTLLFSLPNRVKTRVVAR